MTTRSVSEVPTSPSMTDLVHSAVFDFGVPHDCETELLIVQGDDFIVSYTTDILDAIQQLG